MATREEKIKNQIYKVNLSIQKNYSKKAEYQRINKKLDKVKEYLNDANNDFKNGGHILPDQEYASKEFSNTLNQIDKAKEKLNKLVDYCTRRQTNLYKQKKDLENSL